VSGSKRRSPPPVDEVAELRAEVARLRRIVDDVTVPDGSFQTQIMTRLTASVEAFAAEQRALIVAATRALAAELATRHGTGTEPAATPPPQRRRRP